MNELVRECERVWSKQASAFCFSIFYISKVKKKLLKCKQGVNKVEFPFPFFYKTGSKVIVVLIFYHSYA